MSGAGELEERSDAIGLGLVIGEHGCQLTDPWEDSPAAICDLPPSLTQTNSTDGDRAPAHSGALVETMAALWRNMIGRPPVDRRPVARALGSC